MACLLDTHALIWFINGDNTLTNKARTIIEQAEDNYVSVATLWEIAIKISIGKLEIHRPFKELQNQIYTNNIKILPISFEDTVMITTLPHHHRDPFDRIIIAQALNNQLSIITKDNQFKDYGITIIW